MYLYLYLHILFISIDINEEVHLKRYDIKEENLSGETDMLSCDKESKHKFG